jgi:pimeloyl-ACP methyl ester carboxylesterase
MSRAILEAARSTHVASQRVLLLPPAYAQPEDFLRVGFAEAVSARGLDLDLVLIELRLQSVTDRSVLVELHKLIVAARTAGCVTVWLGGISLGAYIALACAERHWREVDGLCLFAPYLGSHIVTQEIERAGGVRGWEPGELAAEDEERRIWRFIKAQAHGPLPIHLGLGRDDRFGARHRTLAAALAADRVDLVPGGHEWPVWRTLWERFLDARIAPQPP